MGVAECVNDGVDVERVWLVSTEAEAVQKAKRLVDIAIFGAESVNLFGPVRGVVGDADVVFWFKFWWLVDDSVSEEECSKR